MKPFCALLHTRFTIFCSLPFIALEITLYKFDSKEIGLQFLKLLKSFFLGIRWMVAPLKLAVRLPFMKHEFAYFRVSIRRKVQHFFIILFEKPSSPDADLKFAFSSELSNSLIVKGDSSAAHSSSLSLEFFTTFELQMVGPYYVIWQWSLIVGFFVKIIKKQHTM